MYISAVSLAVLAVNARLGYANPQLSPRSADPSVIGYFSASNGGFSDGRTCDYPQTVSTSGNYAQCCPATGACPFYTTCSGNTLLGGGNTGVPCNDGVCNTAVLLPTAGASGGKSNLACWQNSLGSSAFTLVQDIGSATVAPAATTGTAASPSGGSSAASGSSGGSSPSSAGGNSAAAGGTATSSPSKAAAAAAGLESGLGGSGLVAAILVAIEALL